MTVALGLVASTTITLQMVVVGATLVPVVLATALWILRRPTVGERGALVLASAWVLVGVVAVNAVAVDSGWWSYGDGAPALLGMSVPLLVGWVVLWGVAAPLFGYRVLPTTVALAIVDLIAMPLLHPAVVLGDRWLFGELLLLAVVAAPAIALARMQAVARPETLMARLIGQIILFAVVLLWLIPSIARGAAALPNPSPWLFGAILGLVGAASLPGLMAVVEFGLHGGTPWPWDRTERPVRSGPYRFVRSPMQASGVLVMVVLALMYRSPGLGVAAASCLVWSASFCRSEAPVLAERWGAAWRGMALDQRRWLPSWRPHPRGERAILWVDLDCDVCRGSALPLLGEAPIGLDVRAAADHRDVLTRLRYERADGVTFEGVAAFGAALEHVNLGLALAGWLLRLPVMRSVAQTFADAFGLGPRPARARQPAV